MNVTALIVEQLDEGGLLKTFRIKPNPERQMIVAFPNNVVHRLTIYPVCTREPVP